MPFWRNYYHIIWTTKNREPLITAKIEPRLYQYLINKAGEIGVFIHALNGWTDHVHLIITIPPKLSVAEVVKRLKGASSHDININQNSDEKFYWQRGYGVLTLGQTQLPKAIAYVENQKIHHGRQTIIPWLERVEDADDPPIEHDQPTNPVPPIANTIREIMAPYELEESTLPF